MAMTKEAAEALRLERIRNVKAIITGKGKVDHIPHYGNYWTWKYYDTGFKLSEVLYDYDKMYEAFRIWFERYPMDIPRDMGGRNPVQLFTPIQRVGDYVIDDDIFSIAIPDQEFILDGEYDAFLENPKKYLWETLVPRKYTAFQEERNSQHLAGFVSNMSEFVSALGRIGQLSLEYGIPAATDSKHPMTGTCGNGFELLFCALRGMKRLAVDVRRQPDKVEEVCRVLDEMVALPKLRKSYEVTGSCPDSLVDCAPSLLAHIILNHKQFERFYWPTLKRVDEACRDCDKLGIIFGEGSIAPFYDFFRDMASDRYAVVSELDDPYEMKEALPNMVICAGPTPTMLGQGTPEDNIALIDKYIEEIGGEDHRMFYGPGKMISYPADCSRENLSAICRHLESIHF